VAVAAGAFDEIANVKIEMALAAIDDYGGLRQFGVSFPGEVL
jgi:hypothetical protein